MKYEIDAEISKSNVSSVDINLPDMIIGFSKAHAIEVTDGKAKYGGKIWARKSDKVLKLGIDGQNEQTIEFKLTFIATGMINEWTASNDQNVKFGSSFMTTLAYHNRNIKQDSAQNDEVVQYAEATIPAEISVPLNRPDAAMETDNEWNVRIKWGELLLIVKISPAEKVDELKKRIEAQSRNTDHWTEVKAENQRLIFNGRVLQNIEILRSVQHFNSESVVQLQKMTTVPQGANQAEDRIQHAAELNQIATQFNQTRIYQRNFDGCVRAAQRNIDPNQRGRFNQPNGEIITDPKVTDLGELTENMANTMMLWSHQLEELGQLLQDDPELPYDRTAPEYQQARRLIQNNFDACRYISPQLSQFAKFVIPLGRNPGTNGRPLKIVQPRPRQPQQQQ